MRDEAVMKDEINKLANELVTLDKIDQSAEILAMQTKIENLFFEALFSDEGFSYANTDRNGNDKYKFT